MASQRLLSRYRLWEYLIPVAILAAMVVVCVVSLIGALAEVGRTYPGFFTYSNGVVAPMARRHFSGMVAGVRVGETVVRVDDTPVTGGRALRQLVHRRPVGERLTVWLTGRSSRPRAVSVTVERLAGLDFGVLFALPFAIGVVYLLVGAVVLFYKRTRAAALMFALCVVAAAFYVTMFDAHTGYRFSRLWVCYPLLGAVSLHLFVVFPEEHRHLHRARWLFLPYGVAGTLCALRIAWVHDPSRLELTSVATSLFLTACFVADLVVLVYTGRRTSSEAVRKKAKVIIVGLVVTILAAVVWSFAARYQPGILNAERVLLVSALFPGLVTYAVLKRNIFDIDAVLRLGVASGVATAVVVAVYLLVVLLLGLVASPLAGRFVPWSHATLAVLVTLVAAVLFHPLRMRVQRLALRLFYRETVSLEEALLKLVHDLPGAPSLADAGDRLVSNIVQLLKVRGAALLCAETGRDRFAVTATSGELPENALEASLPASGALARALATTPRPRPLEDLLDEQEVRAEAAESFAALRAALIVPLMAHGRLVGVLTLTRRRDGADFRAEDLTVLAGATPTAALAVSAAALVMEQTAQERLASLGSVAAVMIHEIKNPLGIIKVSAGALRKKFHADESGAELARCIEEEVDRMNASIHQILTFARPRPPSLTPCDLGQLCARVVKRVTAELEEARVSVACEAQGNGALTVRADPDQIEQVLINLLGNAREAMPSGGEVTVTVRPVRHLLGGRAVEVGVRDNGPGIDTEAQRQLFRPFFTTKRGGTGLGLAIVKHILENHRGHVRVESAVGEGSTFIVTLPA